MYRHKYFVIPVAMLIASIASGSALLALQPQNVKAWSTDWSAFVTELGALFAKSKGATFPADVNAAFNGRQVTWTGKVFEIHVPAKESDSGMISMIMKYEELELPAGKTPFLNLTVTPAKDEWKSWASVSAGQTVLFTTTLDKKDEPWIVSLTTFMNQPPGQQRWIGISTRGGTCVKVIEPAQK